MYVCVCVYIYLSVCVCMYSGVWISRISRDSKINSTYQNFYLTEFVCISFNIVGTKKTIQLTQNFQLSKFYLSGLHCMCECVCVCVCPYIHVYVLYACKTITIRMLVMLSDFFGQCIF